MPVDITGDTVELREWLDAATIAPAVADLRPDYRALLVVTEGLLAAAESGAGGDPDAHPHVTAWHEAFRAFGAKPKRVRPSVDALLRRAPGGLPRVDRLTDVYNAVSVAHV
ncbi:MAG: hypothetical protein ACRDP3_21520, partial [Streptomyces sp.]